MLELCLLAGGMLFTAHRAYQALQKSTRSPCLETKQMQARSKPVTLKVCNASPIATAKLETRSSQDLAIAGVALGLAGAGALSSPILSLASLPPILYVSAPSLQSAYQSVVHEQRIGAAVPQSLATLVCLLNGYYVAPALGFTLLGIQRKLLLRLQQQACHQRLQLFADLPGEVAVEEQGRISQQRRSTVQPGTQVVVEAGNLIPVDGVIVAGVALVSQKRLTGDAHPLTKQVGDPVFAASLLLTGRIVIRTQQVDTECMAGQVVQISQHAIRYIPEPESALSVREQMAPYTLGLGALTSMLLNPISAAAVMQDSLGYESEEITPVLQSSFLTKAAGQGVLIRSNRAIATLAQVDTLVFSRTILQSPGLASLIAGLRQQGNYTICRFTSSQQPLPRQVQIQGRGEHLFSVSSPAEEIAHMQQWRGQGKRICYIGDGICDRAVGEQAEIAISLHGLADLADNPAAIILLDGSWQRLPYLLQLAREFATQQNRTVAIGYAVGVCGLASVLLFNAGVGTVLLINSAGVAAGVANALLPNVDYETDRLGKHLASLWRALPIPTPSNLSFAQRAEGVSLPSLQPI